MAKGFLMNPVAISVQLVFGEIFVEGDGIGFAKFLGLGPGVAFDLETFEGSLEGEMAEDGMGKFME